MEIETKIERGAKTERGTKIERGTKTERETKMERGTKMERETNMQRQTNTERERGHRAPHREFWTFIVNYTAARKTTKTPAEGRSACVCVQESRAGRRFG